MLYADISVCCVVRQICELADKYHALVFVDESHASGFFGKTGRLVGWLFALFLHGIQPFFGLRCLPSLSHNSEAVHYFKLPLAVCCISHVYANMTQ